ncbi:MAG: hypothetical protein KAU23_08345, partial [Anaerolineales bacterium]|nr:hypothetical protein [Anaerolineales bacterium]
TYIAIMGITVVGSQPENTDSNFLRRMLLLARVRRGFVGGRCVCGCAPLVYSPSLIPMLGL